MGWWLRLTREHAPSRPCRTNRFSGSCATSTPMVRLMTRESRPLSKPPPEPQRTRVRMLSGPAEAELTFLAVRRWFGWSSGCILLFDIGGGSLELAQGIDEVPDVAESVPLGAGRSTVAFLPDDPPSPEQLNALRHHAATVLAQTVSAFGPLARPD